MFLDQVNEPSTHQFELAVTAHWLVAVEHDGSTERAKAVRGAARDYARCLLSHFELKIDDLDALITETFPDKTPFKELGSTPAEGLIHAAIEGDTLSVTLYVNKDSATGLYHRGQHLPLSDSPFFYGLTLLYSFQEQRSRHNDPLHEVMQRALDHSTVPFTSGRLAMALEDEPRLVKLFFEWTEEPGSAQQSILSHSSFLAKLMHKRDRWKERLSRVREIKRRLEAFIESVPGLTQKSDSDLNQAIAEFSGLLSELERALQTMRREVHTAQINVRSWETLVFEPTVKPEAEARMSRTVVFRYPRRWVRQMELDLQYQELAYAGARNQLDVLNTMTQARLAASSHRMTVFFGLLGAAGIAEVLLSRLPRWTPGAGGLGTAWSFVVEVLLPVLFWLGVLFGIVYGLVKMIEKKKMQKVLAADPRLALPTPSITVQVPADRKREQV